MNSNQQPNQQNEPEPKKYADGSYRYVLKIVDQELGKQSSCSVPELDQFTHKKWGEKRKWVVVDFLERFKRDTSE